MMRVTFPDGLQPRARVTSWVCSSHLWPRHLPHPRRLSPTTAKVLESSHLPLPHGFLVPNPLQVAWWDTAGCDSTPHHQRSCSPSNPHKHDFKACWLFCWEFKFAVTHVPPATHRRTPLGTAKLSSVLFYSLSCKREKGCQRQRFAPQMHCLSAVCSRPWGIGSATHNT